MFIKLTRNRDTYTDRETGEERKFDDLTIYLNPTYIKRVERSYMGDTVIAVHGCRYDVWCKETPDEVYEKVKAAATKGGAL